jgi:hypothetical protein
LAPLRVDAFGTNDEFVEVEVELAPHPTGGAADLAAGHAHRALDLGHQHAAHPFLVPASASCDCVRQWKRNFDGEHRPAISELQLAVDEHPLPASQEPRR